MSRIAQAPAPAAAPHEGSLDDIGAVLCAIAEWRLLDAAADVPKVPR